MKSRYIITILCLSGVLAGWAVDDPVGIEEESAGSMISGKVYYDSNENQVLDPGEAGKAGAKVSVYLGDELITTTMTNPGGHYTLKVIGGALYTIVLDNGYSQDIYVGPREVVTNFDHGILLDRIPALGLGANGLGVNDHDRGLNILNPRLLNSANILRPRSSANVGIRVLRGSGEQTGSVTPFTP